MGDQLAFSFGTRYLFLNPISPIQVVGVDWYYTEDYARREECEITLSRPLKESQRFKRYFGDRFFNVFNLKDIDKKYEPPLTGGFNGSNEPFFNEREIRVEGIDNVSSLDEVVEIVRYCHPDFKKYGIRCNL